ncbi:MAG: beta-ACP synthase [Mediterranea sp.]|nr:beta-ACP synthase [Mediterranea sp.]
MEHPLNIHLTSCSLISSLGFGVERHVAAIQAYQSGIVPQPAGRVSDEPMLAALIDPVLLKRRVEESRLTGYTRLEQLFILCIQEVLEHSGADLQQADCALLLSTTKGNVDLLATSSLLAADSPAYLWKMAERVGHHFGAANRVEVISNACISGLSALIVAKRWIESGRYRQVVVAGGDVLSHFITSGFHSLRSVSAERCRPYDSRRDGLSLGEACGAIVLEAKEGADGIVLAGGAISNDANHITGPSRTGDGLALAIHQALDEAGVTPDGVSFVNAHGTATVYNDEMESKALHLTGLADVPVNSLKSYLGHTLGASGIIETILCAEQLRSGILYGTLGFERLGVPMPIHVSSLHQRLPMRCCVKTASGFGGCNAAVVLSLPAYSHPIRPEAAIAVRTDKRVTLESDQDFHTFIRTAYKEQGGSNPKFYKMDDLCKLGYVAAEQLLQGLSFPPEKIGILLANASASLDTDSKQQALISQEGDHAASPALFVYTLPNVVLGEICIRHKIQGENTFFVSREYDERQMDEYARIVMAKQKLSCCIVGWCELYKEHYYATFKTLICQHP